MAAKMAAWIVVFAYISRMGCPINIVVISKIVALLMLINFPIYTFSLECTVWLQSAEPLFSEICILVNIHFFQNNLLGDV